VDWEFRVAIGAAVSLGAAVLARRLGALTRSGLWAAGVVGTLLFAGGGWNWLGLVGTFFITSSLLTRWEPREPGTTNRSADLGGRRWDQVAANGGVAALAALVHGLNGSALAFGAAAGAVAAATADTWATEVGRWSPTPPRLITTGVDVPPGASGGITPAGTAASAAGAVVIGVVAAWLAGGTSSLGFPLAVAIGGITGSILDSVLGATLEGRLRWLNNSAVNLLATAWGAGVVLASAHWWRPMVR